MNVIKISLLLILVSFLSSCNRNLTEDEKKEMWSKAQTTGEIFNRSGTNKPNSNSKQKSKAMYDAQNRLTTGGGLFGKSGIDIMETLSGNNKQNNTSGGVIGMPINPYLWKASLDVISFMPLSSTDPFAGTIITDWYTSESSINQRCKLNIFIKGAEMKTNNLKVLSFCQELLNDQWINQTSNAEDNIKLENAILNRAKKLKLSSG